MSSNFEPLFFKNPFAQFSNVMRPDECREEFLTRCQQENLTPYSSGLRLWQRRVWRPAAVGRKQIGRQYVVIVAVYECFLYPDQLQATEMEFDNTIETMIMENNEYNKQDRKCKQYHSPLSLMADIDFRQCDCWVRREIKNRGLKYVCPYSRNNEWCITCKKRTPTLDDLLPQEISHKTMLANSSIIVHVETIWGEEQDIDERELKEIRNDLQSLSLRGLNNPSHLAVRLLREVDEYEEEQEIMRNQFNREVAILENSAVLTKRQVDNSSEVKLFQSLRQFFRF